MESKCKRESHSAEQCAGDAAGTAVFNVGGRHFEVLRQTVEARPTTLLALLLEEVGTAGDRPIFVDANPDRFSHILDWYRYGEMYMVEGCPVRGVLRDARFFLLPDAKIIINGTAHDLHSEAPALSEAEATQEAGAQSVKTPESKASDGTPYETRLAVANAAYEAGAAAVKRHWPVFEECMGCVLAEVQVGLDNVGKEAARGQKPLSGDGTWTPGEMHADAHLVASIGLYDGSDGTWWEEQGVCSMTRCRVLQNELIKRGFLCEISDRSPDVLDDDSGGPYLFLNVWWRSTATSGGNHRRSPATPVRRRKESV